MIFKSKLILFYPYFLILFFTIIGFIIRIFLVSNHPPIDVDEYSIAYNAYAITQWGKDEWGIRFPLFFKAFGDYKLPLDIYFVALLFKIFDANFFWLRFPAVFFGTLYIPLIYLFLKQITKSHLLIFLGVLLMTFSPYGIFFSRTISGSISGSFFIFLSILLFINYIRKNRKYFLLGAVFSLSVSLYAYPSSWLIAPIFFIFYVLYVMYKKRFNQLFLFLVFIIFFTPIIFQYLRGGSRIRYINVSSNLYKGLVLEINEFRHHTKNDFLSKVFHNKGVYIAYTLSKNYLTHFDINILSFKRNIIASNEAPFPILLFCTLPFFYIGLIVILKNLKNPVFFFIFLWIVISPLPSFITDGGFHSKRYLTYLGSDIFLIVLGLQQIRFLNKQKIFLFSFLILLILQVGDFIYSYFFSYRYQAQRLDYKANILASLVKENHTYYDSIIYTSKELGEPQIYPLFATLYPVDKYIKEKKYICNPWCYIKPFNKFYYTDDIKDITNYLSQNIQGKKILGLFSKNEFEELKKNTCFKIINIISPPKNSHQILPYYQVEFKTCSI